MLLYVNCFNDFQEPCIPHQSLTRQQRRSRDLHFETETSSKSPRLENLQIMPKCFYKFSKNCHHHFEVEILRIFGIFDTCLCYSYLQIQQTKRTLNWRSFTQSYCCSVQSLKTIGLRPIQKCNISEFWPFVAKFCNLTLLILAI